MNVLILATGVDTGGQGYRIREAFARNRPDWTVNSVAHHGHQFGYPEHLRFSVRVQEASIRPLYDAADVFHARRDLVGWNRLDRRQGKPTVLHHHGTKFRLEHGRLTREAQAIGAQQIASTLDLTLLAPDVTWVPSPYDLRELEALRQQHYAPHDGVRVGYFPTSPKFKSSELVAHVVGKMGVPFQHNLRGPGGKNLLTVPWREVLEQKATVDVYVDQVPNGSYPGGYGNNAIEAWGMGLPVVAGVAEPARSLMLERFGTLPFVEADRTNLSDVLRRLIDSAAMREEYAQRGREHVERWHDGRATVEILEGVYARAGRTRKPLRRAA